jgi:hypothetical protein
MSRICENCGCAVGPGQGRWEPSVGDGPPARGVIPLLRHKAAGLCEQAVRVRQTNRNALTEPPGVKNGHSTIASGDVAEELFV